MGFGINVKAYTENMRKPTRTIQKPTATYNAKAHA